MPPESITVIMPSDKEKTITPQDFFFNFQLGFKQTPWEATDNRQHLVDMESRYLKAVCLAIGSGGVYTEEQVRYLKGFAAVSSLDQTLMDSVEDNLREAADLLDVELMSGSSYFTDLKLLQTAGRNMVYDMYNCAALADYPEQQMVAISLMAEELGVGGFGVLEQIKKQVELEREMRKNRIKLLYPEGHEMLDEKYSNLHKEQ